MRHMTEPITDTLSARCRRIAGEMVGLSAEIAKVHELRGGYLLDAGLSLLEWAKDYEVICSVNNGESP